MRIAAKRDSNERAIIETLEAHGCLVKQLNEWDLQVQRPDKRLFMLEVKTPKGKLEPSQEKLLADGWDLYIVRSEDEALAAVGLKG